MLKDVIRGFERLLRTVPCEGPSCVKRHPSSQRMQGGDGGDQEWERPQQLQD